MSKQKKDAFMKKELSPEELLKFEIAEELGLGEKVLSGGWRSLTAKESGRIGGLITKKKREMKREAVQKEELF
ncbi:MAG: small, acid-soluble spore protein, alpha/beta type [bacterium]|nr:small, acid-soluble spore protein, alpha/beta type [bacterium]